jgi:hypothetical protein
MRHPLSRLLGSLYCPFLILCACTEAPLEQPVPEEPAFSAALQNGHFLDGLEGWTTTGDANAFSVFEDKSHGDRWSVSTFVADANGKPLPAMGSLYQDFVVPMNASALRFAVHGGQGQVRLLLGEKVLHRVSGMSNNDQRIPVSWGLLRHRGKRLRLRIDDGLAEGDWAFVSVSGFDLVRDIPCPLTNADFSDGLAGWKKRGDASRFVSFRDGNVGNRWSVTTAVNEGRRPRDAAKGVLHQSFEVPDDAIALRFVVHGGDRAFVRLWKDGQLIEEISGQNSNEMHVLGNWNLEPHRGETLRLSIEDHVSDRGWAFIGTTGFDLITTQNGS